MNGHFDQFNSHDYFGYLKLSEPNRNFSGSLHPLIVLITKYQGPLCDHPETFKCIV